MQFTADVHLLLQHMLLYSVCEMLTEKLRNKFKKLDCNEASKYALCSFLLSSACQKVGNNTCLLVGYHLQEKGELGTFGRLNSLSYYQDIRLTLNYSEIKRWEHHIMPPAQNQGLPPTRYLRERNKQ